MEENIIKKQVKLSEIYEGIINKLGIIKAISEIMASCDLEMLDENTVPCASLFIYESTVEVSIAMEELISHFKQYRR